MNMIKQPRSTKSIAKLLRYSAHCNEYADTPKTLRQFMAAPHAQLTWSRDGQFKEVIVSTFHVINMSTDLDGACEDFNKMQARREKHLVGDDGIAMQDMYLDKIVESNGYLMERGSEYYLSEHELGFDFNLHAREVILDGDPYVILRAVDCDTSLIDGGTTRMYKLTTNKLLDIKVCIETRGLAIETYDGITFACKKTGEIFDVQNFSADDSLETQVHLMA